MQYREKCKSSHFGSCPIFVKKRQKALKEKGKGVNVVAMRNNCGLCPTIMTTVVLHFLHFVKLALTSVFMRAQYLLLPRERK